MAAPQTVPQTIEITDFSQGLYLAPAEESGVPLNALMDATNVVIDPPTQAVVVRDGFERAFEDATAKGYRIYAMHPYISKNATKFIMCVLSANTDAGTDNVKVMAWEIGTGTWTQVSPSKNWNSGNGRHWGTTVDGIFYGGGEQDEMYSWEWKGSFGSSEWKSSPGTANFKTYGGTDRPGDYAFQNGDIVSHSYTKGTDNFTENFAFEYNDDKKKSDGIRYKEWKQGTADEQVVKVKGNPTGGTFRLTYDGQQTDTINHDASATSVKNKLQALSNLADNDVDVSKDDNEYTVTINKNNPVLLTAQDGGLTSGTVEVEAPGVRYERGEHVSVKLGGIWKTFKCIKKHESSAVKGLKPPRKDYWKKITAPAPIDPEDKQLNRKYWTRLPNAPQTKVAVWHGDRLWARADGRSSQTLQYSRVAKVGDKDYGIGKDKTIGVAGNPQWEPDDWRTGGAPGAGFLPFETKEGDAIESVESLGYYLLVLKRYHTFSVSGLNPDTWTRRELTVGDDPVGAVGVNASTTHEGFAYFISDRGFYSTDGTEVKPVPGSDKVNEWLRNSIDWDGEPNDVLLFSYNGFVWMSLPTEKGKEPNRTLLYHPPTESFWKYDISMQAATVARYQGTDRLFFSTTNEIGDLVNATYDWGSFDTDGDVFTVDNSGGRDARHRRQGRRLIGGTPEYNLFKNPGFEADNPHGKPYEWQETTPDKVKVRSTKSAAKWGRFGAHITNKRHKNSTKGPWNGYEGIFQTFKDVDGTTHRQRFKVRRGNWRKNNKKPDIKIIDAGTKNEPTEWNKLGRGWWGVTFEYVGYTGSGDLRARGILVGPGEDVEIDMAQAQKGGARPFFDGESGEPSGDKGIRYGDKPYIMRFGDVATDDEGLNNPSTVDIAWHIRTAWMAFGAGVREERRVRRVWALVRGEDGTVVSLRGFINHRTNDEETPLLTTMDREPTVYAESMIPPDASAYQLQVEGDRSPGSIIGIGVDTEPRRIRFGS